LLYVSINSSYTYTHAWKSLDCQLCLHLQNQNHSLLIYNLVHIALKLVLQFVWMRKHINHHLLINLFNSYYLAFFQVNSNRYLYYILYLIIIQSYYYLIQVYEGNIFHYQNDVMNNIKYLFFCKKVFEFLIHDERPNQLLLFYFIF
jgi:hypothetical protein